MSAPIVTIFVRHATGCKYAGDEFTKRCDCKKHLRWTQEGKQHRMKTGARSWAEAEEVKRSVVDQLAGRVPTNGRADVRELRACIDVFIQDKRVQSVTEGVIGKYTSLLYRLHTYCEGRRVHTVQGLTRDLLTGFLSTWPELYPSSTTRAKVRERLRSFLRYCYEAQWLDRVPPLPKMKVDEPETQPLTPAEYERLLRAVRPVVAAGDPRRRTGRNEGRRSPDEEEAIYAKVRAFLETMRWTGLAIRDTLTLRRDALAASERLHLITTKRAKTGTPVSVPIPPSVAEALLALPGGDYFFWSGNGLPQSATSNWGQRYIAPVFKAAGIVSEGNMLSHRLRDTFAVDLLEKGVPMEEVSKLLGHTSIRTTEKHYAKWSKGRQDRLNSLVVNSWGNA